MQLHFFPVHIGPEMDLPVNLQCLATSSTSMVVRQAKGVSSSEMTQDSLHYAT